MVDCLNAALHFRLSRGVGTCFTPGTPMSRWRPVVPCWGHLTISAFLAVLRDGGAVTWVAGTIEIRPMLGAESELREPFGRATEESKVRGIANLKANDLAGRISDRQS